MNVSVPLPQRAQNRRQRRRRASNAIVVTSQGQPRTQPNSNQQIITVQAQTQPSKSRRRRNRRRRTRRKGATSRGTLGNSYVATLMDPWNVKSVKVPDPVTFPSSTFSCEFEKTIIIDASSQSGLAYLYPWNSSTSTGTSASAGVNPFQYVFGNAAGTFDLLNQYKYNWANQATITTLYDSIRPVSAGIQIVSIGNSTQDGGELCVGVFPREVTSVSAHLLTYDGANDSAYSRTFPFKEGAYVTWKPMDNRDMEYLQSNITGTIGTSPAPDEYIPAIYVAWYALAVGAALKIKVIANFEGVAAVDTMSILTPSYSAHNPTMLDNALRWASNATANMGNLFKMASPYIQPIAADYARRALLRGADRMLTG